MNNSDLYFSKQELINQWLELYPNDHDHPDLEHNALAGNVMLENGLYIKYIYWKTLKENKGLINGIEEESNC